MFSIDQANFTTSTDFNSKNQVAVLPGETTSSSFYYKDGSLDNNNSITSKALLNNLTVLTASNSGITNSANLNVKLVGFKADKLVNLSSSSYNLAAGQVSDLITFELEQADGSPAVAASDTTINLSSLNFEATNGDDIFLNSSDQPINSTNPLVVLKGNSEFSFKIEPRTAKNHTDQVALTSSNYNYTSSNYLTSNIILNVVAGSATKLLVTSNPQTIHPDYTNSMTKEVSQPITVALADQFNNLTTLDNDLTVNASSSSTTGWFISNPLAGKTTTSAVIAKGSTSTSFYYKDLQSYMNPVLLTFSGSNLLSATQNITVRERIYSINLSTSSLNLEAGQTSDQVIVTAYDRFGNPVTAEDPLTLNLTSTDASFNMPASITVGTGASTTSFSYQHTSSLIDNETYQVTVRDSNNHVLGAVLTVNVVPGVATSLRTYIAGNNNGNQATNSLSSKVSVYSPAITVVMYNRYGYQTIANKDLTVDLTNNAGTNSILNEAAGKFYTKDANNSYNQATSLLIPKNSLVSSSLYYRQTLTTYRQTFYAGNSYSNAPSIGIDNYPNYLTLAKQWS